MAEVSNKDLLAKIEKMIGGFQYQIDSCSSQITTKSNQINQLQKNIDKLNVDMAGYVLGKKKLVEERDKLRDQMSWEVEDGSV